MTVTQPAGIPGAVMNYVAMNNSWGLLNEATTETHAQDGARGALGMFYRNSHIGVRDLFDGASNIFMLGERCFQSAKTPYQTQAGVSYLVNCNGTPGTAAQHLHGSNVGGNSGMVLALGAALTKINDTSADAQTNDECRQSFSSEHEGGAYFLFALIFAKFLDGGGTRIFNFLNSGGDFIFFFVFKDLIGLGL